MSSSTSLEIKDLVEAESGDEAVDQTSSGIDFVDILFALVIAKLLEQLSLLIGEFSLREALLNLHLFSHLTVASTLTITSWIGYRGSLNSPKFKIRFPNLPLYKFLLDVSMVAVYWFAASSLETDLGAGDGSPRDWKDYSAVREVALCVIGFGLYVLWDRVSCRMKPTDPDTLSFWAAARDDLAGATPLLRPKALEMVDYPQRRHTTVDLLMAMLLLFPIA